jgi:hypothetical protein
MDFKVNAAAARIINPAQYFSFFYPIPIQEQKRP